MLGSSIIMASAPFTVGYAIHAFRKSAHRGWALTALVAGSLMAFPIVWLLPMCAVALVRQLSAS